MTENTFPLTVETDQDGITISQDCPSPEWSITGEGGRTDMVFIPDEEFPAILKAMQQRMHELNERESL